MEFSFKHVSGVLLMVMICSIALFVVKQQRYTQGEEVKKRSNVTYVDYEETLNRKGVQVQDVDKPKVKQFIYHMRKGNYGSFSYDSLIQAQDNQGNAITNKNNMLFSGHIDGSLIGVNIIHCTIFDNSGNYLRYKVAVIIEGEGSSSTIIHHAQEGMLV